MIYKTYKDYRDAWAKAYTETPPVPLNVDIELASLCNLRCPFCFIPDPNFEKFIATKSEDGKPRRRLMPKEMAFRIINECAEIGVPALKFNFRGESTLHPDYSKILKYAKTINQCGGMCFDQHPEYHPFHELLVNTNANCPDHAIDGLMAATKVMVSLDSMSPEIYSQMRVGGNLERAKEVIGELVRRRHPNVWVRRVLTKINADEDFFGAVRKEWGDKVHVSQHYCFDRNAKEKNEVTGCSHDDGMPRRYCGYPSQRLVISSSGYAYPCCLDLHETMPIGSIVVSSLLEIWNGEPIKQIREQLKTNDTSRMTDTCRNCESWMAFDAPQRNFVQDVEILESKGIKEA